MPLESEQGVIAVHAVAVIGDADKLAPAAFDFNADAVSPRIERVFEEFLYYRRGTIDNFAGGNLVCHLVRKNPNPPHGKRVAGRQENPRRQSCSLFDPANIAIPVRSDATP